MEHLPEWLSGLSALGSLVVAIVALRKANDAISQVKNLTNSNTFDGKVGNQNISGSGNKTATGAGNTIS